MKIQALGPLTGASGEREKGEVFVVDKTYGEGLIARGYAVEIKDEATTADKPAKGAQAKE
ncbi:hypothetical protein [Pseudomonas putida]|jgi:hypothetical protein|uniref:Uncharacterized protein n=1 Tax=Pseudomonas putida (strain W619) TaxID=390235 RepID=B1JCZ3_PSEPW|nr:hypothetical protein [Pseudomonas putida]MBH3471702.1 hypothetical protein [Pseudomonas putida]QQE82886.1 hypothetical protein JET17_20005 [Pseudomonas putida]HEN8714177.1 hypothetical protein [Pseudomonas putida]HEN8718680.1 hypothetical protein [Pseudomonas putida]